MDATEAWKAQQTRRALDELVTRQHMSKRLEALEIALAYEVEAHIAAKNELTTLRAKVAALEANTQRAVAGGSAVALKVSGVELFVHHEDGEVTAVFAEPDQDLCALIPDKEIQNLEWMLEDVAKEEASHV